MKAAATLPLLCVGEMTDIYNWLLLPEDKGKELEMNYARYEEKTFQIFKIKIF